MPFTVPPYPRIKPEGSRMTDIITVVASVAACLGLAWFVSGRIANRKRKNGRHD